ncbi:hypothetical protein ACWD0G_00805 [Streptomyces goshikiensis]
MLVVVAEDFVPGKLAKRMRRNTSNLRAMADTREATAQTAEVAVEAEEFTHRGSDP